MFETHPIRSRSWVVFFALFLSLWLGSAYAAPTLLNNAADTAPAQTDSAEGNSPKEEQTEGKTKPKEKKTAQAEEESEDGDETPREKKGKKGGDKKVKKTDSEEDGESGEEDDGEDGEDDEKPSSKKKAKAKKEPVYDRSDYQPALVLIKGSNGSGTGFICKIRGIPFLVTNIHILDCADASNSFDNGLSQLSAMTLDGKRLTLTAIFAAEEHDLCIIRFAEEENYADIALDFEPAVDAQVQSGDDIVIPGNSMGGGTMVWTTGEVVGLGPTKIEHDAPVYKGNSGSPIIHIKNKKVIGVLSYAEEVSVDSFVEKSSFNDKRSAIRKKVRHFGYRIDSPQGWYPINLPNFSRQQSEFDSFVARRTSIATLLYTDNRSWRQDRMVSAVFDKANSDLRQRAIQGRVSRETMTEVNVSVTLQLGNLIKDDIYHKYTRHLRDHKLRHGGSSAYYPYFTPMIEREVKIRDHLHTNLREIEKQFRQYQ